MIWFLYHNFKNLGVVVLPGSEQQAFHPPTLLRLISPGQWPSCPSVHYCPSIILSKGVLSWKYMYPGEFLKSVCICRITHHMYDSGVWNRVLAKKVHIWVRDKAYTLGSGVEEQLIFLHETWDDWIINFLLLKLGANFWHSESWVDGGT